jgi:hypothetical protein
MLSKDRYFQDLSEAELWQRYCGFLELTIDEFMDIQRGLLMDQIDRVSDSILGKKIMGDRKPKSVDEFRQLVPLTTYDDYEPYLSQKQEDALAEKPYLWCHSAGRGGLYKWVPYGSQFLEVVINRTLGGFILALSEGKKGQVNLLPGSRILAILPPPQYATGSTFEVMAKLFPFKVIPPFETTEQLEFEDRVQLGFDTALKDGVDLIIGIASILVRIGGAFTEHAQSIKLSWHMLHPKVINCLLRAWLRSQREKRSILPKDLWPVRATATGGVDTAVYKEDLTRYWGVEPYEFYGCTEIGLAAFHAWNKKNLTFSPDNAFLEFLPDDERLKHEEDARYQPKTVLMNEVEEGKLYELVVTQFYGMPLLRYRVKDLFRVISLKDNEAAIELPQMVFQRRTDDVINIGSMAWLDEKTIWRAIANTGINYTDWAACKEFNQNQGFLRLYIELKEVRESTEVADMIDEQLRAVDTDYKDIKYYLGYQPVMVRVLSPGTFHRYMEEKKKEGADLAHLKPEHMNPSESAIKRLLQLSEAV